MLLRVIVQPFLDALHRNNELKIREVTVYPMVWMLELKCAGGSLTALGAITAEALDPTMRRLGVLKSFIRSTLPTSKGNP